MNHRRQARTGQSALVIPRVLGESYVRLGLRRQRRQASPAATATAASASAPGRMPATATSTPASGMLAVSATDPAVGITPATRPGLPAGASRCRVVDATV